MPLPLSVLAAMAAKTEARFSGVTVLMPSKALSSAALKAGEAVPPAATTKRRLTASARVLRSETESTSAGLRSPTRSLSRLRPLAAVAGLEAKAPKLTPTAW
jgi:hypothetical protein